MSMIREEPSHKLPLILALLLHITVGYFFHAKSAPHRLRPSSHSSFNAIQAFTVNGSTLAAFAPQKTTLVSKKEIVKSSTLPTKHLEKPSAKQLSMPKISPTILRESMLREHAKELQILKKERNKMKQRLAQEHEQETQKLLRDELAREQQLIEDQGEEQSGTLQSALGDHRRLIHQKISSHWIKPENLSTRDFVKIFINIAPGGIILEQRIVASSGNKILERSAQAAITNASPLPLPEKTKVFDEMRTLIIVFRDDGLVNN